MRLLAATLLSLHFTAPANAPAVDTAGRGHASTVPVRSYVFYELDGGGALAATTGYGDRAGRTVLTPHAPGTRETVWLSPGANGGATTVYVMSMGTNGGTSVPSNGCVIGRHGHELPVAARRAAWTTLDVPIVRQARERCGQAALAMVLRYYGADRTALHEVDAAYDPVLHGSLITDLAGAARRAGYDAAVATLTPDSLIDLLSSGVPPILLYQNGRAPLTVRHFGVVTGWDASHANFTLLDGGAAPRVTSRGELAKRWETAGSQALVVRLRQQP